MRCDVGSCWNRGNVNVQVFDPPSVNQSDRPGSYFFDREEVVDSEGKLRPGRLFGLCYGCYLRLLRVRRRAGMRPWLEKPIESKEFWAAFEGWEPEPEDPSDDYLKELEAGSWKNR